MTILLKFQIVDPLFAIWVGIFSGFLPVWKVSQLDSHTALGHE